MILVFTGNGKGKTTSAIGTALRTLGHGGHVLLIQFMKESPTGELEILKKLKNIEIHQVGAGFYKVHSDTKTEEKHRKSAKKGLDLLREKLPELVVLDEINIACSLGLIDPTEITKVLEKNPKTSFILTGRNAPQKFIDIADLVTEMREVKHPFQKGKPAQEGIDF